MFFHILTTLCQLHISINNNNNNNNNNEIVNM